MVLTDDGSDLVTFTGLMNHDVRVAAVQAESDIRSREHSTERAVELIHEAGAGGAKLIAFGETWLPGYPSYHFAGGLEMGRKNSRYLDQAVTIGGPETDRLCEAADAADADVAIGIVERDPQTEGSVYCTLLFISADGEILGRHRKMKPTGSERAVWSDGDAVGLRVHERPYARISGLNCWEHRVPLQAAALAAEGPQIHVAAWPGGPVDLTLAHVLSAGFACQTSSYVIAVGAYSSVMPELGPGASAIFDPNGTMIAGPAEGETILYADLDAAVLRAAKMSFDAGGHYSRRDLINLTVDRRPQHLVSWLDDESPDIVDANV